MGVTDCCSPSDPGKADTRGRTLEEREAVRSYRTMAVLGVLPRLLQAALYPDLVLEASVIFILFHRVHTILLSDPDLLTLLIFCIRNHTRPVLHHFHHLDRFNHLLVYLFILLVAIDFLLLRLALLVLH